MGLLKSKSAVAANAEITSSVDELSRQLTAGNANERRAAARSLRDFSESAQMLCDSLGKEQDPAVRHTILTSVIKLNSDEAVRGLLPYLRSETAWLRNAAVEALQQMPEPIAGQIPRLLRDTEPDVRIFAIDILRSLCHRDAPLWLGELIQTEEHVNVCAAAVDCLAEIGTPDMIPALQQLSDRFPQEFFMSFAVKTAIARIALQPAQSNYQGNT